MDSISSVLPVAPALVPAAPFSDQLSKQEIREKRIQDTVKGVFSLGVALFLGHLAQHALREVREVHSIQSVCINLYAGIFLGLYAVAASSIAYQNYLRVTEPDGIQKTTAAQQPQQQR